MDTTKKLEILADAAKYDVACTSSGYERRAIKGSLGNAASAGICHSFAADGRCIALLKVLMSNACKYHCAYCTNRAENDFLRTTFEPRELADLTIAFYRRNYIEGLFLSSGVLCNPDNTSERMLETLRILRDEYLFNGYIHVKAIPGTSPLLLDKLGLYADRMSVNLELPSRESLALLAPDKTKHDILAPMHHIEERRQESADARQLAKRGNVYLSKSKRTKKGRAFAPAGQSTQMIIGATPESDYHILNLSASLYKAYALKRVFFNAYLPVNTDKRLPTSDAVQLDREHRLYQADWLMRFYRFEAEEIIDEAHPYLDLSVDPKANWALNNLDRFPMEINRASYNDLLRIPGIGVVGAKKIMQARRHATLRETDLQKMGIAYKRARYFITCNGFYSGKGCTFDNSSIRAQLAAPIDGGYHGRRSAKALPGQLQFEL